MPKLTIDNREVEVPDGATLLEAARKLGIDIPALCFRDGCTPSTSCLVCLVRINGNDRLVPSCATAAAEGMQVESETEAIHTARRTALELLLSDHLGDCVAPCQFGCPAQMDIPTMLRQIAAGDFREAIATVKRDIALPAILGRICPAPCEKVCRRGDLDAPVSICLLKRLVADIDLASGAPHRPACKPATGKRVAIVGAGSTGLSAAYYLRQQGHACTVFDQNLLPGGRLLAETTESQLPRGVLQAEIATITGLGIELLTGRQIGSDTKPAELRARFDAALLACGLTGRGQAAGWDLAINQRGIAVAPRTFQTEVPGLFAAGSAIRGKALVVRSAADGKEAAVAIDQFLSGAAEKGTGPICRDQPSVGARPKSATHKLDLSPFPALFSTKIGRMTAEEVKQFTIGATDLPRREPASGTAAGFTPSEGTDQAARCLHCDCRGLSSCKLRKYASLYNADPRRFKQQRRVFQQDAQHAEVIYEPGKCIDCGLCIQIAAAAGEPLGLTFVGRGFDVRVAVPLDRPLSEALTKVAAECVATCPTAALAWKSS